MIPVRSLLLLCALVAAPLASCNKSEASSQPGAAQVSSPKPSKPAVIVVTAEKSATKQALRLSGTLEPWERARLFAKVTGYVSEIAVDIGDEVKKGQVLAKLSVPEMAAEQRKASAEIPATAAQIDKAKADAELARVTLERLTKLREREPGAITEQEVDVALAQRKSAEAQVAALESNREVAKARVSQIGVMMGYSVIKAPFSGVVTARFADIGALVAQGADKPIVEVSRIDQLRLVVDLPEVIVPQVKLGQKVRFFLDALPGKSHEGTVARMAGALRSDTRSMRVEIDVDNSARELGAGMYAKVDLGYGDLQDAIALPATALRTAHGETFVFAVDEGGVVRRVPVGLLKDDGAEVVVTGKELAAGARVVVAGPPTIAAGDDVEPREQSQPGAKR